MNQLQIRENQARDIVASKMSVINVITGGDKAKSSTFAASLTAMANERGLQNCSVESVLSAGLEIVRLGLNPNKTFGQAYVVPFRNKYGESAQLQIGYKGWVSLAYRNGWIFRALCVYRCDDFSMRFAGVKDEISFNPNYDERDETNARWVFENLRGVIVYAKDAKNNEFSEFVPFKKLEQLRLKSQNQKSSAELTNIWAEWAEEMYKAKAIKYVATRLPITEQMQEAINAENEPFKTEQINDKAIEVKKPLDLNEIANLGLKKASELKAQKTDPIDAEMEDVPVINIDEPLPHDELQSELMRRGLNENEAEKVVMRLSKEQAKAYLDEPSSIDSLLE
ncbi:MULTISPECIES: recombinase RecT [unclassified Campylobacter]|uniref:recombinase RecT n=1 Tax=unclassified Campylobacter TaxID=2593542 RepID=UPI003D34D707